MQATLSRPLKAVAVAAVLALASAAACASDSFGSVQITSFDYTVAGGSLAWTGVDSYQTLQATASDAGGIADYATNSDTAFAIGSDVQTAATAHAGATAIAGERTIGDTAYSASGFGGTTGRVTSGAALSQQSDAFTLTGASTVTFNVGYTISVSSPGGNRNDTYGEGLVDFTAGSYLGTSGGTFDIDQYSFNAASGMATYSGVLTTSVTLTGSDDVGYYALNTAAYAFSPSATPVPEPSGAALLLAGLGLSGTLLRRRRR